MRWTLLTLFPGMFDSVLDASLFGKAVAADILQVDRIDYREFTEGRHRVVDEPPFGGGAGMVIKVEPVARALDQLRAADPGVHVVLLSPQGVRFDQDKARRLARHEHIGLLCGRYEGVDDRIRTLVDQELSVGDFVLSGGEPAAWILMDAVSRLVPGVLGAEESIDEESFGRDGLLEYPQYTRPREFRGMRVPDVLLSGDHAAIADWRRRQSLLRTAERRPDLIEQADLSTEERAWLEENT